MKNKSWLSLALAVAAVCASGTGMAAQVVSAEPVVRFAKPLDQVPLFATYTVTSPDTMQSTGLGICVHYNSSLLEPVSHTPYSNQVQPVGEPSDDTDNADGDSSTDKYIVFAWVDFDAKWPGVVATPLTLLNSLFKARTGFAGSTRIRLSASATAGNTSFQSTPLLVCAKPTVSVVATDAVAAEQGSVTGIFTFTLDAPLPAGCGSLTVGFQVDGSAVAGTDYTALPSSVTIPAGSQSTTLVLSALNDAAVEPTENVSLALVAGDSYQLGNSTAAQIAIQSDDLAANLPTVTLASSRLKALEGTDNIVTLTVLRSAPDLTQALSVYLQVAGTAVAGSDYQTLPLMLEIPAGQHKASLLLQLINDSTQESNKTFTIGIQDKPTYQRGDIANLEVLIQDDELRSNTSLLLTPKATPLPQQVPALGEWAMLLLSGMLGLSAFSRIRRTASQTQAGRS